MFRGGPTKFTSICIGVQDRGMPVSPHVCQTDMQALNSGSKIPHVCQTARQRDNQNANVCYTGWGAGRQTDRRIGRQTHIMLYWLLVRRQET